MFTINGTLRLAKNTQFFHHIFHLKPKYLVKRLKREEKGLVICQASDTTTNKDVDIMKFSDIFRNHHYGLSLLRQIQIYKAMKENKYIRSLVDIVIPTKLIFPGEKEEEDIAFNDVYLVFESSMDNLEYILAQEEGKDLIKLHCKSYIWQVVTAVHHLHIAGVIHGNLTTLNLAFCPDRKLIQLYNFHQIAPEVPTEEERNDEKEVEYHQGYTAPEFLLGHTRYHASADIWAIGCIFAQLLNGGTPLFSLPPETQPTEDNWLLHIIKMVRPTREDMDFVKSEADKNFLLRNIDEEEGKDNPLHQLTLGDDSSRDLLKSMLHFNPSKRISVEDALQHKFFLLKNIDEDEAEAALLEILDEEHGIKSRLQALARATALGEEGIAPYKSNEGQLRQLIWKEMEEF